MIGSRKAQLPGVFIDEVGTTPKGRKLQVIRVEGVGDNKRPKPRDNPDHRTEHATEAALSWAALGALKQLLSGTFTAQRMRQNRTWLFLLIEDPDGSADCVFDHLTEGFFKANDPTLPSEIVAYARYFTHYVQQGNTIDVALTLHNVEANECTNICCPFINANNFASVAAFNQDFFTLLGNASFLTDAPDKPAGKGMILSRMYGWAPVYGSYDLAFEVNDRYPARRLGIFELEQIGAIGAKSISFWLISAPGIQWHEKARTKCAKSRSDL